MKRALAIAAAAVTLGSSVASAPAAAQQCGVFTDVMTSDFFCVGTQWMKNRNITSGCTATTYCPGNVVTRSQMAFFLNQLGKAITPQMLTAQSGTPTTTIQPNQFQEVCGTAVVPAATYPQAVRARGSISIPATGPQLSLTFYVSQNAGPYVDMSTLPLTVGPVNGVQNLTWSSRGLQIPPNNTLSFVIAIVNPNGSGGNLNLSPGLCAIDVDVFNANPTVAPFDEQ